MTVQRLDPQVAAIVEPIPADPICPACWANLTTARGIATHNIHAAAYGERSYPAPQSVYVTRLPARL